MSTAKTKGDVLSEINEKLGGVLGFLAVREFKGDVNKMLPRLREMGLSTKMIALITGLTDNAIAIRFSRMKKPAAKKAKGKAAKKVAPLAEKAGSGDGAQSTDSAAE